jgi:hypothetical protein
VRHGAQQGIRKLAPERGPELRDALDREERFQGLLALPLRREREGRIAVVRQCQCDQGCKEWHHFGQHQVILGQGSFQLVELLVWRILWLPAQGTLEQLGHGIEGCILIIR